MGSIPLTFDGGYLYDRDGSHTPTHNEQATVLVCRHCKQGVCVLEEQFIGGVNTKEGRGGGEVAWRGFHWWPLPGATADESVPAPIRSAFNEAVTALAANCPRASAVMARRTLEAIADEKGEPTGKLADRLSNMAKRGLLHEPLADWSREVRLVGNTGAHFDAMKDVSQSDAKQLVNFISELLRYLYVLPAQLQARRQVNP